MRKNRNPMQEIAQYIDNRIPEGFAFIVLISEQGESGRMHYASNSPREDVIKAMKEFIEVTEGKWGTHQL